MRMWWHAWLIWIVNCRLWHVGVTVGWLWMRMLLRNKIRALSPGPVYINIDIIIPRRRSGAGLRSMLTLLGLEDTIWHRRGVRRSLMSDMLESRLVLELRWHHLWFHRSMCRHARSIIIVVVVHAVLALSIEIGRTLMFICTSILAKSVSNFPSAHKHSTYVLVSCQNLSNICTRVLV